MPPLDPPQTRRERARAEQALTSRSAPLGRTARLGAQAVVLALVVGATSAFTVLHKSVTVDVDGATVQLSAFGRTVGDVLADSKIRVGERDLVAPGLGESISSGSQVVVRHAHEIAVEVDGKPQTVWTTALTVGEAVEGLDLRGGQTLLSASRSASLGREVLRVSTQKTIHLVVDGQVIDGVSSAATVREALREIGLVLDEGDAVSVPLDATAVDGLVVLVTRAHQGGQTVTEAVPFDTTEVDDPTLVTGNKVIATRGKAGVRTAAKAVVARAAHQRRAGSLDGFGQRDGVLQRIVGRGAHGRNEDTQPEGVPPVVHHDRVFGRGLAVFLVSDGTAAAGEAAAGLRGRRRASRAAATGGQ